MPSIKGSKCRLLTFDGSREGYQNQSKDYTIPPFEHEHVVHSYKVRPVRRLTLSRKVSARAGADRDGTCNAGVSGRYPSGFSVQQQRTKQKEWRHRSRSSCSKLTRVITLVPLNSNSKCFAPETGLRS